VEPRSTRCERFLRASPDLGGRSDHPDETRHDVEHVLARTEGDVLIEPRGTVGACIEGVQRGRKRSGDELGADRGIGPFSVQQSDDPPGAVRIVEGERALKAGTHHDGVLPLRGARDRVEVQQAAEHDLIASARRFEDRPRSVGRRQDQRLGARLEELARRGPDIESLHEGRLPLAAHKRARNLAPQ
jgi:hypothetical protein